MELEGAPKDAGREVGRGRLVDEVDRGLVAATEAGPGGSELTAPEGSG